MPIHYIEEDELDPVIKAHQIIQRLYDLARPVTSDDVDVPKEHMGAFYDWRIIPHVGLVDLTDVNPLHELEEYLRIQVMMRLEKPISEEDE